MFINVPSFTSIGVKIKELERLLHKKILVDIHRWWQKAGNEMKKGMKVVGTSNVSHVSTKPLRCTDGTTPVAGHVVEVTLSKSRF